MRHLPLRSAYHWAVDAESALTLDAWRWGTTEELLAALVETVDFGNRLMYSRWSKSTAPALRPIRIRRPRKSVADEPATPRGPSTTAEIREFFGAENIVVRGEG
jgi:hypothetical protein